MSHAVSPVTDNPAESRFELKAGDHLAIAVYRLAPGVITFTHTEVPRELSGQGIGSALARGALEQARARGLKVVARCPFIAGFIGRNPEFAGLLASDAAEAERRHLDERLDEALTETFPASDPTAVHEED